jgi:farnesyl-diphosphate farnesyltransferase
MLNASRRACLSVRSRQVSNAMTHATDSLEYLSRLRDPQVFRFCAIPQVMAIATLAECYDNPKVFKAVVKIPRSMRHALCVCVRVRLFVVCVLPRNGPRR